jgi:hypothetical protein
MLETTTLTPLGHRILEHWRRHRPTMVEKLANGNQLQQAVFAAHVTVSAKIPKSPK